MNKRPHITSQACQLLVVCLSVCSVFCRQGGDGIVPASSPTIEPIQTTIHSITFASTVPIVQTAFVSDVPHTLGIIYTKLNASINPTLEPVSNIEDATNTLLAFVEPQRTRKLYPALPSANRAVANIFVPIASNLPPVQFNRKPFHPEKGHGIKQQAPVQTNKFYANFFLGSQKLGVFTHPYTLFFTGNGIAVSHVERNQLIFGTGNPPNYFINPLGIKSIVLSASDLGSDTQLTTDSHDSFSVRALLSRDSQSSPSIIFPVVQGQGFTSAIYMKTQPILRSEVFFRSLTYLGQTALGGTYKYKTLLQDGKTWLIYITPNGIGGAPPMTLTNSSTITGPPNFSGIIQVAKAPTSDSSTIYDKSAGAYALSGSISATVQGTTGAYTISWKPAGLTNRYLLMYTLPHHRESMDTSTKKSLTKLTLQTTTKGLATALLSNSMTLVESQLPTHISFAPMPEDNRIRSIPQSAQRLIARVAALEMSQDLSKATQDPGMYWNGKALAKYAMLTYSTYTFTGNQSLAAYGLDKLKDAFSKFVQNKQTYKLYYDSQWGGITSSASYLVNDPGADYGGSYYNDHHFHYAYFVYTGAVIGYLDPSWLKQGGNKAYVESLVRDYANSIPNDKFFPFSRMFDWYHGHSWATGLFETADGKNEESTSEDAFSLLAVKLWGKVTGDASMEARGNMMMAVLKRSLRNYFLLESDNVNQPAAFVPNKESGILFENKLDHATFFGAKPEYIAGIHMLPISPTTAYMRSSNFVREEWNTYFSNGRVDNIQEGPWRHLLYANMVLIDPKGAWRHFADPKFDVFSLDSGASLTWYLSYIAALGGAA